VAEHELGVFGSGIQQWAGRETSERLQARFDQAYEYATKSNTHLWIATAAYFVSDDALTRMDEPLNLDLENLAMFPGIGCYVCEEPFTQRLRHRKCKGEPGP
jgi:hypothetical protein